MLIIATAIHPDGTEEELKRFELVDIARIMEKDVMQKETTTRPKLSLSFELSRSHLIQLLYAKISADESVLEEIESPKVEKKETTEEGKDDGSEKKEEEEGGEGVTSDDGTEDKSEATESETAEIGGDDENEAKAESGDASESAEEPEV